MRILIIDDHPLFREALSSTLQQHFNNSYIFEASSAEEALGMIQQYHFDLIMLDNSLPGENGIQILPDILNQTKESTVIMFSGAGNSHLTNTAIKQGAKGFISKLASANEIKNAINLVLAGEKYISPSLLASSSAMVHKKSSNNNHSKLTPRQKEVLELMANGLPNKLIASRLHCSTGTVKLHVSAILQALNVKNRTEAVLEARNWE